jgi:hypothetical protein
MSQTLPIDLSAARAGASKADATALSVPWFVWTGALAVTSIAFGLYWDISWHMTIGRDTFWTPAHLAVHFGGLLAAGTCMYLIFSTTFGHDESARATSVRVWGFRGPLGAFFTAWGGVTMVTSAPFDNWWHNSFGLDVEILSPPHVVLGLGIFGVGVGLLLLLLASKNRAEGAVREKLDRIFLYICGLLLLLHMILISEFCDVRMMHSSVFYRAVCFGTPTLLVAYGRASDHKWGSTILASIYVALFILAIWVFPIFPASPKLGPVYTNVTHMVPMGFPVLLILPAFALDFVMNHFADRGKLFRAFAGGAAFLAALLIVQWPFGNFLISPLARNPIFGENYFPYQMPPSMYASAYRFEYDPTHIAFATGLISAWLGAIFFTLLGILYGNWLRSVRR